MNRDDYDDGMGVMSNSASSLFNMFGSIFGKDNTAKVAKQQANALIKQSQYDTISGAQSSTAQLMMIGALGVTVLAGLAFLSARKKDGA